MGFRPIVMCTDGSELANRAATTAFSLLDGADRTVLVTVIDRPDYGLVHGDSGLAGPMMSPEAFERSLREASDVGQRILDELAEQLGDPTIEKKLLKGSPGPALCALAEEVEAAVLVVGSRGRGGVKRAMLGSVSDHVVRKASCPVLVVR